MEDSAYSIRLEELNKAKRTSECRLQRLGFWSFVHLVSQSAHLHRESVMCQALPMGPEMELRARQTRSLLSWSLRSGWRQKITERMKKWKKMISGRDNYDEEYKTE